MDELFQQFLREKRFLHNVSENTIDFYKCAYIAYKKRGAGNLTKTGLKEFVIRLKESGLKTGSINCYIRGLNSFLAWLHENEHINEPLKMSLLREERTILKTFSDEQLRALVSYRQTTGQTNGCTP